MFSFAHTSLAGPMQVLTDAGLRLTPTPGDEQHARIHFARSYLEIRAQATGARAGLTAMVLHCADGGRRRLISEVSANPAPHRYRDVRAAGRGDR